LVVAPQQLSALGIVVDYLKATTGYLRSAMVVQKILLLFEMAALFEAAVRYSMTTMAVNNILL
jgi:hypothetical protein